MLTLSPESYGIPYPSLVASVGGVPAATSPGTVTGTGLKFAWICRSPVDGTIERVLFLNGGTAPTVPLRVSIQSISNGIPDGVVAHFRNVFPVLLSAMNDSGILTSDGTDAGARRTVRAGEVFAIVFDIPTGTVADSVSLLRINANVTGYLDSPQASFNGSVWTRITGGIALGAIKYVGFGYVAFEHILPLTANAGTETLYNTGSAIPEFGIRLKVPVQVLVDGFWWKGNALAGDAEMALFDQFENVIALSPTMDADVEVGDGLHFGVFTSPVVLDPDRRYRLILRPKTGSNISLASLLVHSPAIAAMHTGPDWLATKRIAGSPTFIDSDDSMPMMGLLAEPAIRSGHVFEMELSGVGAGWTDISEDVLQSPAVTLEYGITGAGPQDLVASTGRLSFALDNSDANSAELLGYYSPDGPNCRPGFKRGVALRYSYRKPFESDYYRKFIGRLMAADPEAGQYGTRRTVCDAYDWMNEAASFRATVAAQLAKTHNQVLTTLLAAMARQPTSTTFDTGDSVFAYALDSSQTETSPILSEIQRLCQSEYARCYIRGGMNAGGNLRLEKRTARLTPTAAASFFGTMQGINPKANIKNRAKVTAHPRIVDAAATTVLFSKPNQNNPVVNPGQTILITARYNDPANRAQRVGGTDMVPPVATTDYLMNSLTGGGGTNLTANFTVTATFGANQADLAITNTGGTPGYITFLQLRGRGIYDYNPIDATTINQPSIDLFGESLAQLDMPYQSDLSVAQAVADFIVASWLTPGASEATMRCVPRDDVEMDMLIALEPGSAIAASELVTGMNGMFYIQHVRETIEEFGRFHVTFEFLLQRALVQAYWQLGTAGFGELGNTTVLAPL